MLSVEVAEPPEVRVSELLLREALRLEGETDSDNVTFPLKPLSPVTVIVEEAVEDCERLRDNGFKPILKSDTNMRIETECTSELLVPVTVTV